MTTDIVLKDNEISLVGPNVSVEKKITVGDSDGKTSIIKGSVFAELVSAGKLKGSTLSATAAEIGELDILPRVGDVTTPGKISIGNTTLTDEEIRCKKITAPSFVGWTAELLKLEVKGDIEAKSITVSGDITARKVTEVSDVRCKQNIAGLSNSLDKILGLQGVSYNWKENELTGASPPVGRQFGFIAQDVEKVIPEAVTQDADGRRSLAYSSFIPLLVEAVKYQEGEIKKQNEKIDKNARENEMLQKKVFDIERKLDVLLNGSMHH